MTQIQAFQQRTAKWVKHCFGADYLYDREERALRLLEEALETAQASGLPVGRARRLLEVVYDRPIGGLGQEIAGTGVTLLAMAQCSGFPLDFLIEAELARIEAKDPDHFRQRNREKAKAGVGNYPTGQAEMVSQ